MRQKLTYLLAVILLIMAGAACTKVTDPYYVQKAVYPDTTKRAVIIEDYTGHTCVNCASAGKTASSLEELYHGQVFAIAVHAGPFSTPSEEYAPYLRANYANETSEAWYHYESFQILGNPIGMVNRRKLNDKISFFPSEWTTAIQSAVILPKVAVMTVHNSWNNSTKTATTTVSTKFLSAVSGTLTLTVCVLEDSIYNGQKNNDIKTDSTPIIKHYRFMHMLRGSVNGSFGEQLAVSPSANNIFSKSYTINFTDKDWVPNHCSILAFISDDKTREILHAAKKAIK